MRAFTSAGSASRSSASVRGGAATTSAGGGRVRTGDLAFIGLQTSVQAAPRPRFFPQD